MAHKKVREQNKTLRNAHTKRYIEAVFEQRLRQEGFTCPDDKLLCWYRVRNFELVDTVIFRSNYGDLPVWLDMYYEVLPLFTKPLYTQDVYHPNNSTERLDCRLISGMREEGPINAQNLHCYSEDILVYAPPHGNRGLYTFTDLALPHFEKASTLPGCYELHKKMHIFSMPNGGTQFAQMSREFIDEVLYMRDFALIPSCVSMVQKYVRIASDRLCDHPKSQLHQEALEHWRNLQDALTQQGLDWYMQILEQRKQENITYMEDKLGVAIR